MPQFARHRLLALLTLAALATAATAQAEAPGPVRGLDGELIPLVPPEGGATAVVFYSTECPISNGYSPLLNAIVEEFPADRFRMVGLCVDPDLTDEQVAQHAEEYDLKFAVARDRRGSLARRFEATVSPEAVVLDDEGKVRYRGRIDDQWAARRVRKATSTSRDLRDAIAAVLAGKPVAEPRTEAVGCPLPEPPKEDEAPSVTFARDVAPILQRSCQECHREGQVGPFALMTYEQARKRAGDLASVVETRLMPPWKPDPAFGQPLQHPRSLTDDEIATLAAWAEAGAPEGDPADLPAPRTFPEGWALGTPDLVLEIPEFTVPADGPDLYRCFVLPSGLSDDVAITAIEYRPGNRRVVHHLLSYTDTSGKARERDRADDGPGYDCINGLDFPVHGDLGGWAPGNEPAFLPEGIGRALPRGADIVTQIHYHPSGKPETDRTKIGLYFARKPIRQTLHWGFALNREMVIPAGAEAQPIHAEWTIPVDVIAYGATPHMHLLGRQMCLYLTLPDGRRVDLVSVPDWDFNWQNTYWFEHPLKVPAGSVLHVDAVYDNSEGNPRNPRRGDPRDVRWGEATTDEMCIGFLAVVKDGQDLTRPGQDDDLREIFRRALQEERKSREQAARSRGPASPAD